MYRLGTASGREREAGWGPRRLVTPEVEASFGFQGADKRFRDAGLASDATKTAVLLRVSSPVPGRTQVQYPLPSSAAGGTDPPRGSRARNRERRPDRRKRYLFPGACPISQKLQ